MAKSTGLRTITVPHNSTASISSPISMNYGVHNGSLKWIRMLRSGISAGSSATWVKIDLLGENNVNIAQIGSFSVSTSSHEAYAAGFEVPLCKLERFRVRFSHAPRKNVNISIEGLYVPDPRL